MAIGGTINLVLQGMASAQMPERLSAAAGAFKYQGVRDYQTGQGSAASNRERSRELARRHTQTAAVGRLAGQVPGAGAAMGVGKAFAAGGMIAGMATGVTAIVGMIKSIVGMSKIFGTMSKTFFQMFSMMVDIAIMPLIPHFMRFLNWFMREGVRVAQRIGNWFARNGEDIADGVVKTGKTISALTSKEARTGAAGGAVVGASLGMLGGPFAPLSVPMGAGIGAVVGGGLGAYASTKLAEGGIVTGPTNALIGEAGPEAVIPLSGGRGGGVLEGLFSTISGGMSDTSNIFAKYQKKATDVVDKIKISVTRDLDQWYYDLLGGSTVPETIDSVMDVYKGLQESAEEQQNNVDGEKPGLLSGIKKIFKGIWGGIGKAWCISRDWVSDVWGWLIPGKPGDGEEPSGDSGNGQPWYKGWAIAIGGAVATAAKWIAEQFASIPLPDIPGLPDTMGDLGENISGAISSIKSNIPGLPSIKPSLSNDGMPEPEYGPHEPHFSQLTTPSDPTYGSVSSRMGMDDWDTEISGRDPSYGGSWRNQKVESVGLDPSGNWYVVGGVITGPTPDYVEEMKQKGSVYDKATGMFKVDIDEYSGVSKKLLDEQFKLGNVWNKEQDKFMSISSSSWGGVPHTSYKEHIGMPDIEADWLAYESGGKRRQASESYHRPENLISAEEEYMSEWDMWGLPEYQTGGRVPGPVGSPQLGVLHGGEVVLPTHMTGGGRTGRRRGGGGNMVNAPTFNRPMTVQIYTTENASQLLSRIDRMSSLEDASFFTSV